MQTDSTFYQSTFLHTISKDKSHKELIFQLTEGKKELRLEAPCYNLNEVYNFSFWRATRITLANWLYILSEHPSYTLVEKVFFIQDDKRS